MALWTSALQEGPAGRVASLARRCSSRESSTTISAARRTSWATRTRARPWSSTRRSAIEPLPRAGRARTASDRRECWRRTTTPTTSAVTAASRSSTGLPVHVHPAAEPEFPFESLEEGTEVRVGEVVPACAAHAGPPAGARGVRGDRPLARQRAVARVTGDSLFVGDAAPADLAVGGARRRATASHGSCAGSLDLGRRRRGLSPATSPAALRRTMSSKASTTIGFSAASTRPSAWSSAARTTSSPMPAPVAATDRAGADRRAQPRAVHRRPSPTARARGSRRRGPCSTCDPPPRCTRPLPRRDQRARLEASLRDQGRASCSSRASGWWSTRGTREEAEPEHVRGLHAIGFLELDGVRRRRPRRRDHRGGVDRGAPSGSSRTDAVEVLDVRERGGARRRLFPEPHTAVPARACMRRRPRGNGGPFVTICESGARAAVAASVLAHEGLDARPVLDGGIPDWERGGDTSSRSAAAAGLAPSRRARPRPRGRNGLRRPSGRRRARGAAARRLRDAVPSSTSCPRRAAARGPPPGAPGMAAQRLPASRSSPRRRRQVAATHPPRRPLEPREEGAQLLVRARRPARPTPGGQRRPGRAGPPPAPLGQELVPGPPRPRSSGRARSR